MTSQPITRRLSHKVRIGPVSVGGDAPVVVQSMTNTDTADVQATVEQTLALALAGSEIVRVTVNNEDSARAVPVIVEALRKQGCDVPIVGDFHYNGHRLLKDFPDCAKALGKYRNVCSGMNSSDTLGPSKKAYPSSTSSTSSCRYCA